MANITLIDNYDSFTYNLVHYLGELGSEVSVHRNDAISVKDLLAAKPKAVVLSPGPCTPNEAGITVELIKKAPVDLPIMGVCLGHQSIAQAFGGKVIRAPQLMHGKMSKITHGGKGIFKDLPSPFVATRYHSLIVDENSLPDGLQVTARTKDGLIMGMEHIERPIYGVQFHPESIASEHGHQLLSNFLKLAGIKSKKPPKLNFKRPAMTIS
ncbi:MAG: aminodeoxychorismate/anthranilate synthase component II [Hyphomicrobiaceae bacterium]|nr:aminodeoxychorismate/anthranilate synthase component II [Hyphomicrobiaceae bacterium]